MSAGAPALRSTTKHSRRTGFRFAGQLFVAPLAIIVLVLFLVPLGILFFMSTQNWPLLGKPQFNGFDNFAAIVEETRVVRIWGGIHFRSALEASDAMGRQIASYVLANSMRPVR